MSDISFLFVFILIIVLLTSTLSLIVYIISFSFKHAKKFGKMIADINKALTRAILNTHNHCEETKHFNNSLKDMRIEVQLINEQLDILKKIREGEKLNGYEKRRLIELNKYTANI